MLLLSDESSSYKIFKMSCVPNIECVQSRGHVGQILVDEGFPKKPSSELKVRFLHLNVLALYSFTNFNDKTKRDNVVWQGSLADYWPTQLVSARTPKWLHLPTFNSFLTLTRVESISRQAQCQCWMEMNPNRSLVLLRRKIGKSLRTGSAWCERVFAVSAYTVVVVVSMTYLLWRGNGDGDRPCLLTRQGNLLLEKPAEVKDFWWMDAGRSFWLQGTVVYGHDMAAGYK